MFDVKEFRTGLIGAVAPVLLKGFAESAVTELVLNKFALDSRARRGLPGRKLTTAQEMAQQLGLDSVDFALEMPEWLKMEAAAMIETTFGQSYWQDVESTTREHIFNYLENALEDGYSVRRAADMVIDHFGGDQYPRYRANNIVRTELGNAMNAGHSAGMKQIEAESGMKVGKEWVSILGPTTRDSHAEADGQQTDSAEGLFNLAGYEIPWPSHYDLPAGERCNCACTTISAFVMSEAKDDENTAGETPLEDTTDAEPGDVPYDPGDDIGATIADTEPEPDLTEGIDPAVLKALAKLEELELDDDGRLITPFEFSEPPYSSQEVYDYRNALLADGKNPAEDIDSESLKMSKLIATDKHIDRQSVTTFIFDPKAGRDSGLTPEGFATDLPVIVRKDGKDYIRDGHDRLAAQYLHGKRRSADCYLIDLDKAQSAA